jgi:hypothetical protein
MKITENFFIYVDKDGKMPQFRRRRWNSKTHPFFVQYVNKQPVAYHGPKEIIAQDISGDSVWCHKTCEFVSLDKIKQL